jgi:uncharacterized protein YjbK
MAVERELKLELREDEAARLGQLLGPPERVVLQRNHYLDTAGSALRGLGYGLRLRDEGPDGRTLALKGPGRAAGAITERSEIEARVPPAEAAAILAGRRTLADLPLDLPPVLRGAAGAALLCLGTLENERRVHRVRLTTAGAGPAGPPVDLEIELDRTRHPDGHVDHELEVEWPDAATPFPDAALRQLLERAGVPWRPQLRSKLARFLERAGR